MVSGATGVGKTVLLRALCRAIPLDKMIVTVEDDRELGLHVVPARGPDGQVRYAPDGSVRLLRPPSLVRTYEARPANPALAGGRKPARAPRPVCAPTARSSSSLNPGEGSRSPVFRTSITTILSNRSSRSAGGHRRQGVHSSSR